LFLIVNTWIHSQKISDSTNISYKELTEVAKFVAFKDSSTNIFTKYRNELRIKDSILIIKEHRLNNKDSIISKLNKIKTNNTLQIEKTNNLLNISELMYKDERRKKWRWGIVGILSGILTGILLGVSI